MAKHAYLIMAHNQPKLLEILIQCLDYHENDIYVHLDQKWTDFDGTMYFLDDNCLKDNYYGNNSEFDSVEDLVETEEEDVYHYQFTESDIKKLPNKWIPSKFGGIGFTKEISVN